jgi:hypothetical protein
MPKGKGNPTGYARLPKTGKRKSTTKGNISSQLLRSVRKMKRKGDAEIDAKGPRYVKSPAAKKWARGVENRLDNQMQKPRKKAPGSSRRTRPAGRKTKNISYKF